MSGLDARASAHGCVVSVYFWFLQLNVSPLLMTLGLIPLHFASPPEGPPPPQRDGFQLQDTELDILKHRRVSRRVGRRFMIFLNNNLKP